MTSVVEGPDWSDYMDEHVVIVEEHGDNGQLLGLSAQVIVSEVVDEEPQP